MDTKNHALNALDHQLDISMNFLETLNGYISYKTGIVEWFNEFCKHLSTLILLLSELRKEACMEYANYDGLLLYLHQLVTCLSLLIKILIRESDINKILYDGRVYAKKKMKWCFAGIREFLSKDFAKSKDIASFIKWMDAALDKISEINCEGHKIKSLDTYKEAKSLFDEVLSHAMSIAQVTLCSDYKIIRGSSQIVLESLDSLYKELTKKQPNIAMLNLFVDMCTDKLCSLECRVNIAVLKLSLRVFSEYTNALNVIHNFCTQTVNKGKSEELDGLVAEFDLHVDRIMQIGLFAVSCSTCRNSCIRIRSCLASLEALESELVPAFSSILLEKTAYNMNLALILKEHWLNQAMILQKLIFLIIDPYAFCQVIYEENRELLNGINGNMKVLNSSLDRKSINQLIAQSKVLENFVGVVMSEQQDLNIDNIKKAFWEFKNVLHEVIAAQHILLNEKSTLEDQLRVYKRCKILLGCTKTLWYTFLNKDNENGISKDDENASIKNNEVVPATNNPFLDHIIDKGKQIFKDRSILYRSSNSTFNIQAITLTKLTNLEGCSNSCKRNKSIPLSKLVHLRKVSFMKSPIMETSYQIEITDILNELEDITNITDALEQPIVIGRN